jgi:hypothetical protein
MMTDPHNWAAKLDTLCTQVWRRLARAARHATFAMCPGLSAPGG